MRTLGLIGGMTWHSTVDYYRLINEGVQKALGGSRSAEIVMLLQQGRTAWALGAAAVHLAGSVLATLAGIATLAVLRHSS